MPNRLNFYQIFRVNTDGSIEPQRIVRIGGAQLGPGVRFGKGVFFGGIDLSQYTDRDFHTEEDGDVLVITGIY